MNENNDKASLIVKTWFQNTKDDKDVKRYLNPLIDLEEYPIDKIPEVLPDYSGACGTVFTTRTPPVRFEASLHKYLTFTGEKGSRLIAAFWDEKKGGLVTMQTDPSIATSNDTFEYAIMRIADGSSSRTADGHLFFKTTDEIMCDMVNVDSLTIGCCVS